jgi:hypothetical protein
MMSIRKPGNNIIGFDKCKALQEIFRLKLISIVRPFADHSFVLTQGFMQALISKTAGNSEIIHVSRYLSDAAGKNEFRNMFF